MQILLLGLALASPVKNSLWVVAPDQSKSCEPDSGVDLKTFGNKLRKAGVHVLESKKANDGKMRILVCGNPTGNFNAYRIPNRDFSKATLQGCLRAPNDLVFLPER